MSRVVYRKAWEAWYPRSRQGRAAFVAVADMAALNPDGLGTPCDPPPAPDPDI